MPTAAAAALGDRVAFYGSLRRGQPAFRQLRLDRLLAWTGSCTVRGRLRDFGDYPGLVPDACEDVVAELFTIRHRDALGVVDAFEDYRPYDPAGSLYLRARVALVRPRTTA